MTEIMNFIVKTVEKDFLKFEYMEMTINYKVSVYYKLLFSWQYLNIPYYNMIIFTKQDVPYFQVLKHN